VIAGMIVTDKDRNLNQEQKKDPGKLEVSNIEGYSHVDLKWIVKDASKFTVRVESIKGGYTSAQSE